MASAAITNRDEFTNTTDGWLGAVQLNHLGQAVGVSVEPGGAVFLSEEEQILTANAPRSDADNPFASGALKLARRAVDVKNRRPYGVQTGATPEPDGDPELGSAAAGEEVATPAAATPRRRPRT